MFQAVRVCQQTICRASLTDFQGLLPAAERLTASPLNVINLSFVFGLEQPCRGGSLLRPRPPSLESLGLRVSQYTQNEFLSRLAVGAFWKFSEVLPGRS